MTYGGFNDLWVTRVIKIVKVMVTWWLTGDLMTHLTSFESSIIKVVKVMLTWCLTGDLTTFESQKSSKLSKSWWLDDLLATWWLIWRLLSHQSSKLSKSWWLDDLWGIWWLLSHKSHQSCQSHGDLITYKWNSGCNLKVNVATGRKN